MLRIAELTYVRFIRARVIPSQNEQKPAWYFPRVGTRQGNNRPALRVGANPYLRNCLDIRNGAGISPGLAGGR
jgi:hypothetical protein